MAQADRKDSKIVYMETEDAYDRWAEVYDTDRNFLQLIDDQEMNRLLPAFFDFANIDPEDQKGCTIVDLGCGTGRNTFKLCRALPYATVFGLDSSKQMLNVAIGRQMLHIAHSKTNSLILPGSIAGLQLHRFDILDPNHAGMIFPASDTTDDKAVLTQQKAEAIISTLVIEHIPLEPYFKAAVKLLKPGGCLLLTNMHSEMGKISQAGFNDPKTGEKIRPRSYAHTVQEVVDEAGRRGFEKHSVYERGVKEADTNELGPRSKKWVGVSCWYAIMFKLKQ